MADPKTPDQIKRPAWAKHLDDSVWRSYYSASAQSQVETAPVSAETDPTELNPTAEPAADAAVKAIPAGAVAGLPTSDAGAAETSTDEQVLSNSVASVRSHQATFTASTIQEDINSASQNAGKPQENVFSAPHPTAPPEPQAHSVFELPSKEELAAVIMKSASATASVSAVRTETEAVEAQAIKGNERTSVPGAGAKPGADDAAGATTASAPEPPSATAADKKPKFSFIRKEPTAPAVGAISKATAGAVAGGVADAEDSASKRSGPAGRGAAGQPPRGGRRGRVAPDPERPVRGYGLLTLLPMLTLTVLLLIHVASFIYTYSNEVILEDSRQISLMTRAENPAATGDWFVPSLKGQPVKDFSPVQSWYLQGISKFSPFSAPVNLHLAGALAALLFLWGTCLLSKATFPNNKAATFGAGLAVLSCVLFLGGAWFFRPEILGIALMSFSQAMLFKGLQKPERAGLWLVPGMGLAALSVLCNGLIMGLALFIPLVLYLLFTGNLRRFSARDMLAGLIVLAVVIGLWFSGALFFAGSEATFAYLTPFSLTCGGYSVGFSSGEALVFASALLLPWLLLPLLLLDRIAVKLPGLKAGLNTSRGQGILFLISVLLAALAVVGADSSNQTVHPALCLILLPPTAILSAKTLLHISRGRARIFIIITALIFAALTALLALKAGGFGNSVLPWEFSLWAVIPLIGAAAFCTLFLARAAQVSAGRTQLLVYAICWLLMAQVFLFAGMPAALKHLRFSEFEPTLKEKTGREAWAAVYLNTPVWAVDYSLPNLLVADNLSQVAELARFNPVLAVMPETDWENSDKKQYPFRKIDTQVLWLTPYVLAQSDAPLLQLEQSGPETQNDDGAVAEADTTGAAMFDAIPEDAANAENAAPEPMEPQEAGMSAPAPAETQPQDTAAPGDPAPAQPQSAAEQLPESPALTAESAPAASATPNATLPAVGLDNSVPPEIGLSNPEPATTLPIDPSEPGNGNPDQKETIAPDQPEPVSAGQVPALPRLPLFPDTEAVPDMDNRGATTGSPDAQTRETGLNAAPQLVEETVVTSYMPRVTPQINLIYGVVPGMPELNIILRYQQTKPVPDDR